MPQYDKGLIEHNDDELTHEKWCDAYNPSCTCGAVNREPTTPKPQHIHNLSIEVEAWSTRRYWKCECGYGPVGWVFKEGYEKGVKDATAL